ncbi:MAG: GNAT family N-acetyltransferase [Terriglobales bacterium]
MATVIRKALSYLLKPAYEHRVYRLYMIDLLKQETPGPANIEGVEFRYLGTGDIAAIDQVQNNSEWLRGTLQKRLEAGGLCIAGFENGKLAGFNLISFGEVFMPLVNLRRRFRRDEAWSEQIAVVKGFRKHGLASSLRYRIFQELRSRGFRKLYGGALIDNLPSLKLARRVGFREFVDIGYRRLLNSKTWQYTRVRP